MNKYESQVITLKLRKLQNKWNHLLTGKYNTDLIDIYIVILDVLNTIKLIVNNNPMKSKKKGGCKK